MASKIQLGPDHVTIVDDSDLEFLSRYSWYLHKTPTGKLYVRTTITKNGIKKNFSMHRMLLAAGKGQKVDHRNGDGLDNQRSNLRQCTLQQNNRNQKLRPHSSKFKGVTWRKSRDKWYCQLELGNRKNLYIGSYDTEEEAAKAYDEAAKKHFGEFARLNFA